MASSTPIVTQVRTARELVLLAGDTLRLWVRVLPQLVFWWGLGFAVHESAVLISALLGTHFRVLATIVLVLGMIAQLAGIIAMINSLRAHIAALTSPDPDATTPSLVRLLSLRLSPFLAVYAVWGLTQTEVTQVIATNLALYGVAVDAWSVHLTDWRFYAAIAIVTWLVQQTLGGVVRLLERGRATGLLLGALLDGVWVLTTFIAAVQAGRDVAEWLGGRRVAQWVTAGWRELAEMLAGWFGVAVPAALQATWEWIWTTGLPALSTGVALPLMWLALTATVYGRDLGLTSLARGTRLDPALGRMADRTRGAPWAPLRWAAAGLTADLRDKWLPVGHALRLLVAAGPRFLGAYLVLASTLSALSVGFEWLLLVMGGPLGPEAATAYVPIQRFLVGLVFTPLVVALYGAAFARGVTSRPAAK